LNVLTIVTIRGIWSAAHHKADGDKVNVTINNYDDIVIIVIVGIIVGDIIRPNMMMNMK